MNPKRSVQSVRAILIYNLFAVLKQKPLTLSGELWLQRSGSCLKCLSSAKTFDKIQKLPEIDVHKSFKIELADFAWARTFVFLSSAFLPNHFGNKILVNSTETLTLKFGFVWLIGRQPVLTLGPNQPNNWRKAIRFARQWLVRLSSYRFVQPVK